MNRRLLIAAASGAAVIGITTAVIATAGPSYPHAWCGPVLAQFHARENSGQYLSALGRLESQGAPVARLISDNQALLSDEAGEGGLVSQSSVNDVEAAPGDVDKIAADLRQVNLACGQPGNAWKTDNA